MEMKTSAFGKGRGAAVLALLLLSALALVPVSPVCAHAPEGAGEIDEVEIVPIRMQDTDGVLLETTLDDVAELHGHLCICGVASYRVLLVAIDALYAEDEIPTRGELEVVYHHPGKAHKQVFEHVLTAECVTYEKLGNPQHLTADHFVYVFTRTDTGEMFETRVREGVVPETFGDLRYGVKGFEKGWHSEEPTEAEKEEYAAVWTGALNSFMTLPAWELYEGVEAPEESAPLGALVFSGAVIVLLGGGFVYSSQSRGGRRN